MRDIHKFMAMVRRRRRGDSDVGGAGGRAGRRAGRQAGRHGGAQQMDGTVHYVTLHTARKLLVLASAQPANPMDTASGVGGARSAPLPPVPPPPRPQLQLVQQIDLGMEPWQMCHGDGSSRGVLFVSLRDCGMRVGRAGGKRTVVSFRVERPFGHLTQIGEPAPLPADAVYLCTDRSGRYLFTAHMTASTEGEADPARFLPGMVLVHAIGPDGAVLPGALQRCETGGRFAHCVAVHPTNRAIYVPHVSPTDGISVFSFDAGAGRLEPHPDGVWVGVPAGAGPRHLAFPPPGSALEGTVMYANDESGSAVTVFRVSAEDRGLHAEPVQRLSTLPPGWAGGTNTTGTVRCSPSGQHVFVTNRGHDTVATFRLANATTGELELLGHTATGRTPR
eukprot:SAG22_NODE_366_length_11615_cov_13.379125_7_plen_391_part_00